MHRRRPHNKSRNGCQNCKRRKVKPAVDIFALMYRDSAMRYTQSAVIVASDKSNVFLLCQGHISGRIGHHRNHDEASNHYPMPILRVPPSFSVRSGYQSESCVNRNPGSFAYGTARTDGAMDEAYTQRFFEGEETRKIMEISVLEAGLTAPFLMHGVMALSALHLSHQTQSDQGRRGSSWFTIAMHHQNAALSIFRDQLNQINEKNFHASMIFAGLAAAFGFASALQAETTEEMPGLNTLLKIFDLARGLKAVLDSTSHFQQENGLNPLLVFEVPADAAVPKFTESAFDRLVELSEKIDYHTEFYKRAIQSLRFLCSISFTGPGSMTLSVGWANLVPREYLEDLKCRKPFALVVLAHYCVFLHMGQQNWCLGRWGYEVLMEISHILDLEWKPYIAWPLEQVFQVTTLV
ncbi:uncharacterized protein N7483_002894 [Penicillium malachiteum]|uniref:uncharacterized protein n=1 Tax=Penicillium malachiteum TaxID=1324776 RepID=UPI002546C73E|nr:uncharacterized protein N7483_002894 [Penicillium malachiteum]KAJ5737769.1 hypothetical protein N7483_002894 [Penicillium malachiteum]